MSHSLAKMSIFSLLSLVLPATSQVLNPLTNFCHRFGHRTAVIDNRLFIDGGIINYSGGDGSDSSNVNYTNTRLLYAELSSVVAERGFPDQYDNLTKPYYVPSVQGGSLWADTVNKVFFLFGGEYNWTTPPPATNTLWFFDAVYNTWNATAPDATFEGISPASFGASAVDDNRGTAYYYGGWKSNATELGFNGNPKGQSALITYDMVENVWRSDNFIDSTARAEGALFYIPASDRGMLVYLGGIQDSGNGSYTGVPMNIIYLYDIGSQRTYTQTTSGTTPPMRRRFCGGASWPVDRSSYNIYLYGGLPPSDEEGFGFDDVWILSIPSFTWTNWFNDTANQHHSLSCNVVDKGQMIIMGGNFPNPSVKSCDAAQVWGMHNLNLGANNDLGAKWYDFLPDLNTYTVPSNLTTVIGGSDTGGAALLTPVGGFDDEDLRIYLGRKAPTGFRNATRETTILAPSKKPHDRSNIGAIAGGVLGGLAGLIVFLLAILFCLRWMKKRKNAENDGSDPHSPHPMREGPMARQRATFTTNSASKQDTSSSFIRSGSDGIHTPQGSPPPHSATWQSVRDGGSDQNSQYQQRFMEELPERTYSPRPLPYFPPPALPQQYEQPSPSIELPIVRSPAIISELDGGRAGSTRMETNKPRINEME